MNFQTTNDALKQAFNSVLNAEKAGADISELLVKLNIAGEFLSEAQNKYNSGNLENVTSILKNVHQIADQVNADAVILRNESLSNSQINVFFTLIFSIAGSIIFGILLFFVWRKLKHAHLRKQLHMKPKVIENTT